MPHLRSVSRGSGIDIGGCVKHSILNTEYRRFALCHSQDPIHTFLPIKYHCLYNACSSHDVRSSVSSDNTEKWVDAMFSPEDESDVKNSRVRYLAEDFLLNDIGTDKTGTNGGDKEGIVQINGYHTK